MIIKLYEKELKKEKIFRSFLEEEIISKKSKSIKYILKIKFQVNYKPEEIEEEKNGKNGKNKKYSRG